uniref:Uncharacterized protein n=1 Tax=Clytia hemisphaerica TaxID=252671 RepID=A0A7M5V9P8_9CNID
MHPCLLTTFKFKIIQNSRLLKLTTSLKTMKQPLSISTTTMYEQIMYEDIKRQNSINQIPFTGYPFIVIGKKQFECTHGKDRNVKQKRKRKQEKLQQKENELNYGKSKFLPQDTKKVNCPAKITMQNFIFFPDYKVNTNRNTNTIYYKRLVNNKLNADWATNPGAIKMEQQTIVHIADNHSGHLLNKFAGLSQQIDKRLVRKIHESVGHGVRDVREMQRALRAYCDLRPVSRFNSTEQLKSSILSRAKRHPKSYEHCCE